MSRDKNLLFFQCEKTLDFACYALSLYISPSIILCTQAVIWLSCLVGWLLAIKHVKRKSH